MTIIRGDQRIAPGTLVTLRAQATTAVDAAGIITRLVVEGAIGAPGPSVDVLNGRWGPTYWVQVEGVKARVELTPAVLERMLAEAPKFSVLQYARTGSPLPSAVATPGELAEDLFELSPVATAKREGEKLAEAGANALEELRQDVVGFGERFGDALERGTEGALVKLGIALALAVAAMWLLSRWM